MGKLLEIDNVERKGVHFSKCLRIKVEINLLQLLIPGFLQNRDGKEPVWVQFKCERLSNFCYGCGRLGHSVSNWPDTQDHLFQRKYGPEFRAKNIHYSKVETVRLGGMKSEGNSSNSYNPQSSDVHRVVAPKFKEPVGAKMMEPDKIAENRFMQIGELSLVKKKVSSYNYSGAFLSTCSYLLKS
jgi:hypothetical protein